MRDDDLMPLPLPTRATTTTTMETAAAATLALDVSVLLEKKMLFYGTKWKTQRAELARELLEFSPRPQVVLRLDDARYVVLRATASSDDDTSRSAAKYKLLLDVRSMDDVRRAWVYQTAAKTSRLALYVDTQTLREQLLAFVNHAQQDVPTAVLPLDVPFAVPVAPQRSGSEVFASSDGSGDSGDSAAAADTAPQSLKQLIDKSFEALAAAQTAASAAAASGHDSHEALVQYRVAERGFARAEMLVPDARSRELFRSQRLELQRVVRALEATVGAGGPDLLPSPTPAPTLPSLSLVLPTIAPDASASVSTVPPPSPSTAELDERLERLKRFAAQQELARAQREHKPTTDDLRLRLQALRHDASSEASADSLAQRFERLRGPGGASPRADRTSENYSLRESAVDRIIAQVRDELALGLEDRDFTTSDVSEDDDSDSDGDASSRSSSDEDGGDRGRRTRATRATTQAP